MKLQAEIDEQTHEIEITRSGDSVIAVVDGREYVLEASEPEPDIFLLKNQNRIFEAIVSRPVAGSDTTHVRIGQSEVDIKLFDPKRLRGSAANDAHADGLVEIKTAMPGKIVRILVAAGDEVEKGAGVLVVEAMKMQNELKAPKTGTISDIKVAEGATVAAGDVLLTIE